ncbi:MAG: hypothetical protein FD170_3384 [Bacteroidetes bacterium]|nr:MAG: hypothetical protein FD170_3384 [Bacteroidota bacterium]
MTQTVSITIPQGWEKLSTENLEYLSKLIISEASETEIMIRCFLKFAGMKIIKKDPVVVGSDLCYLFRKKGYKNFLFDIERAAFAAEKMRFLVNPPTLFRLPERVKNYVPIDWRLFSVSLEEYLLLDQYYNEFLKTRKASDLDVMMAIVYKPKGEKFDVSILAKLANRFKKVPLYRKYIVYLWFTAVKAWFINKYWFAFNRSSGGGESTPDEMVLGILSALNGGNVTLNKEILATSVHEVLYEINQLIERTENNV